MGSGFCAAGLVWHGSTIGSLDEAQLKQMNSKPRKYREFLAAAVAADKAIDAGAPVYDADEVHAWLERFARDGEAERPQPLIGNAGVSAS